MKLLVVGGTRFLGRATVEAALAAGHEPSLLHRGRTNPGLFPDLEHLHGDRDGDLAPVLGGRRFDAVIDTCGYTPAQVRAVADGLDGEPHVVFVSSISVYRMPVTAGADESAPLDTMPDDAPEVVTGATYGPLKSRCEREWDRLAPGRTAHVRAGLIVGPHDYTERLPHWLRRVAAGGEMLAPGRPDRRLQLVDAGDLGAWMVRLAERRVTGTFHGTGPVEPYTFGGLLEAMRRVTGSDARFTWVDDAFLTEHAVEAWTELPLWIPAELGGFTDVDVRRAIAAGLTFRPIEDTLRAVAAWDATRTPEQRVPQMSLAPKPPLSRERERELLAVWHASRSEPETV